MVAFSSPVSDPILIADDNPDDVFALARRLRAAGVSAPILEFSNAQQVMAFLRRVAEGQQTASILFLDITMPGANGFSVLCWLREQETLDHLRVVITSGSDAPADVDLASSLGADAYLPKSSDYPTLASILGRLTLESHSGATGGPEAPRPSELRHPHSADI